MRRYIISFGVQSDPRYFEWALIAMMFLGIGMGLDSALERLERGKLADYKNVRILKKFDDYDFRMAKDDGEFSLSICRNVQPPDIVPGCFLTRLRYRWTPKCADISADDMGYWYLTDPTTDNDIRPDGSVCYDKAKEMAVGPVEPKAN